MPSQVPGSAAIDCVDPGPSRSLAVGWDACPCERDSLAVPRTGTASQNRQPVGGSIARWPATLITLTQEMSMKANDRVTDGYFSYIVVSITNDGWATVRMTCGHITRILVNQLRLDD